MEKIWYYMKRDRSKYGPYSEQELIALIRQEIINPDEYIWMTELKGWLKLENSIYAFYMPGSEEDNPENDDTMVAMF